MIYSALEGTKIQNASQNLFNVFKCLPLSQQAIQEMEEKSKNAREMITTEQRKSFTRNIRGSNYLANNSEYLINVLQERLKGDCNEEERSKINESLEGLKRINNTDVALIKSSLKVANRANFSSVVADIMDICIFGANKMDYASMPTEGVPYNPNTGRERASKDALKTLSDFLIEVERARSLFNEMKQDKARTIRDDLRNDKKTINTLKNVWRLKEVDIMQLIEGMMHPNQIFYDVADNISNYVGNLFYYPRLDPNKLHEYEIGGVSSKWAVSRTEWIKIMPEDNLSQSADKNPKYNKGTKPRNNDPEILYKVAGRHLVLIFNCFRGFGCFHADYQRQITSRFLQSSILESNGWCQELVVIGRKTTNMDVRYTSREVEKWATLNYLEQKFYTHDSHEGQKEQERIQGRIS